MTSVQSVVIAGHVIPSEALHDVLPVVERHAGEVDRAARYPAEALDALRSVGALSWLIPIEFGGEGLGLDQIADVTCELARRCASTGMIFAMHQIQVACLVRHGLQSLWVRNYLRRIAREQRLLASATSEVGVGGNVRESIACLTPVGTASSQVLKFEKKATTVSYGAYAEGLLTTLRRAPDADSGDQVLVATDLSETTLEQTTEWDTLGMRGTCSPGFVVRAKCRVDQVLPAPFSTISAETMVPVSHILWSHVWLGIAADAFDRAQSFVRQQARQNTGTVPPTASKLSELSVRLDQFHNLVNASTSEYLACADGEDRDKLSTIGFAIHINNLKIAASEAVVEICAGALRICGILGYKNNGPYSVGRHLRDSHSGALMVANDRLQATNAALLLVHRDPR
jgi:acyl-CoA dehydrogenase